MSAESVSTRAAEIVRERGWIQGTMERGPGGPVCAVRALVLAGVEAGDSLGLSFAGMGTHFQLAKRLVMDRLGDDPKTRLPGSQARFLTLWNDHPDTTRGEVLATLEGRRP